MEKHRTQRNGEWNTFYWRPVIMMTGDMYVVGHSVRHWHTLTAIRCIIDRVPTPTQHTDNWLLWIRLDLCDVEDIIKRFAWKLWNLNSIVRFALSSSRCRIVSRWSVQCTLYKCECSTRDTSIATDKMTNINTSIYLYRAPSSTAVEP